MSTSVSKVIAHAWADADFKNKLVSDPRSALAEHGVALPEGITLKVVENTADTRHLVLPAKPPGQGEVSLEELEQVAGGTFNTGVETMC